jgi:hypothetical protein
MNCKNFAGSKRTKNPKFSSTAAMAIDAEDADRSMISASFPSKPLQALRELLAWPLLYSREAAILGLKVCSPVVSLPQVLASLGPGFLVALAVSPRDSALLVTFDSANA